MNLLDMRTVVFSYAISNFICMIVMTALASRYRRRFAGLELWLLDFVLQFIALLFLLLRGFFPGTALETVSIAVANPLIISGTVILYFGLERFTGKRGPRVYQLVLVGAYVAVHEVFLFAAPNLFARTVLLSAMLGVVCAHCAWLLLKRVDRVLRPVTRGVGAILAGFCLLSLLRIAVDFAVPMGDDFFRLGIYDTLALLVYMMFFIVLTFSLALMVNRRLFAVLESDLAGRDQAERIIRLRLSLWEYAAAHPLEALLQKALDEIEALTGSLIGFYHFVDEEKQAVSLQAWSTRTKNEFCKAEGRGMHYAIDRAGVWVDCVRERRPVMHNDYVSLPHRRGMPEGHAVLIRELVVPTMRDGRIVSILGVGNKPTEYEESDVVLVSYIADLVWSIVTQKRADDQIVQLNGRLERLALTDELTGLPNRRAFFIRGAEELRRTQRYKHPLALILFDLDRFKDVNDSYGHDVGDQVLLCMAKTILANVRDVDTAARLGGEEFGILLPNTLAADALILGERLRRAIETTDCRTKYVGANVTASVGVAAYTMATPDIGTLLKHADIAMYQAKREGRNRVCFKE